MLVNAAEGATCSGEFWGSIQGASLGAWAPFLFLPALNVDLMAATAAAINLDFPLGDSGNTK